MTHLCFRVRLQSWLCTGLYGFVLVCPQLAFAQIDFTEVFFDPGSSPPGDWEWVEVRNSSGAEVDLNGYVFDDEMNSVLTTPNLSSATGNTIVPAGGIAVLYNADDISPQEFADAWGSGANPIGVTNFPALRNSGEQIGLWSSLASYGSRNFGNAVTEITYSVANGFPDPANDASIAWNGTGSATDPTRWVGSQAGTLGAFTSNETMRVGQINDTDDTANPGRVPTLPTAAELFITEIMYDPASSPDGDFEFIEIYNNTGATIDFSATNYVLDDGDGNKLAAANITEGEVLDGEVAVLFSSDLTVDLMEQAWGADINFISVEKFSGLDNNPSETVALWDSYSNYENESNPNADRTTQNAAVAIQYQVNAGGWPNNDKRGSIYLKNLFEDDTEGSNWQLSGTEVPMAIFQSESPLPMILSEPLNPGTDIGSPGYVENFSTPLGTGDYNGNGIVDAADYTVWLDTLGSSSNLAADGNGNEIIDAADYLVWKKNFGNLVPASSAGAQVPEPNSLALIALMLAIACLRARGSL